MQVPLRGVHQVGPRVGAGLRSWPSEKAGPGGPRGLGGPRGKEDVSQTNMMTNHLAFPPANRQVSTISSLSINVVLCQLYNTCKRKYKSVNFHHSHIQLHRITQFFAGGLCEYPTPSHSRQDNRNKPASQLGKRTTLKNLACDIFLVIE